jgi:uncharacterized membrane protein
MGTATTWPPVLQAALLGVFVLAAAVWVGGFVTLVVVARVATSALGRPQRVLFFRGLGRAYGPVAGTALLVALVSGAVLVAGRPWGVLLTVTTVLAAALVVATVIGVIQARRMTERRVDSLRHPDDPQRASRVRQGARTAAALRGTIGGLTIALVAAGALLAT